MWLSIAKFQLVDSHIKTITDFQQNDNCTATESAPNKVATPSNCPFTGNRKPFAKITKGLSSECLLGVYSFWFHIVRRVDVKVFHCIVVFCDTQIVLE